jgi:hypothetical protein
MIIDSLKCGLQLVVLSVECIGGKLSLLMADLLV